MFPVPFFVIVEGLVLYAVIGMAIGAFIGWLASLIIKGKAKRIWIDAVLGTFGFLSGFVGSILLPWPRNTVLRQIDGITVATTSNTYQHPELIALLISIIFPLLYETYQFKRSRAN